MARCSATIRSRTAGQVDTSEAASSIAGVRSHAVTSVPSTRTRGPSAVGTIRTSVRTASAPNPA